MYRNMLSSTNKTTGRFEALDSWRGLCACLVVLFHVHGYSPIYTWQLVRNSYLFVDFFFVLSGFVISWNYEARLGSWSSVKRFVILRLGRVYPLHAFMLLCFVAVETAKLVASRFRGGDATTFTGPNEPFAVLTNALLIQSLNIHDGLTWNLPGWSISTEWWTYVVFALVSLWFSLRNWMLLVAAVGLPLLLFNLSGTGMDTTYDYGLLRCILGFALGVACQRIHRRWPAWAPPAGTAAMTVVELLVVVAVAVFVSLAGTGGWSFAAPFVFGLAVLAFAAEAGLISRLFRLPWMQWLGQLSYSIYLTHFLFVLLMPSVVKRIVGEDISTPMPLDNGQYLLALGRNNLEGTLYYAVVLGATLAFSAFTYRWVETPGREWARRWVGRPPSQPRAAAPQGSVERS